MVKVIRMRIEVKNISSYTHEDSPAGAVFFADASGINKFSSADFFRFILKTMMKGGMKNFALNMENVDLIDSVFISELINAAKMMKSANGNMVIFGISDKTEEIIKPLNITRYMPVLKNEDEVLAFYSR